MQNGRDLVQRIRARLDACRHEPVGADRGLTLVELVVSIGVIGVLAVAVMAGTTTVLRTMPMTTKNLGESHDEEQLINYFIADVRSTAPAALVTTTSAGGCSGSDPGLNVVQLTWVQAGTTYRSSYRVITTSGTSKLDRYSCSGTSASTLGAATVVNILDTIDTVPVGWAGGSAPAYAVAVGNVVTLKVTQSQTNRQISVSATLRAELSTLP